MHNQEKNIKSQWHLRCKCAITFFPLIRQAVTSAWGKTSDDNSGTIEGNNSVANCSNWRKVLRLFNQWQWFTALARLQWYFFPIQCDGAHGDPSVSMALGHGIGPTEPSKLVQLIQAKKGPKVKVPQKAVSESAGGEEAGHDKKVDRRWRDGGNLAWRGPRSSSRFLIWWWEDRRWGVGALDPDQQEVVRWLD